MTVLRAMIVDDEHPARRWLRRLLGNYQDIDIVGEAESVAQAREVVAELQPDVVFLDVQMPPETGFDLLPWLPACTRVIFVTAFDSFAVKAFEANALDYLLKPVHPDRLAQAVGRLHAGATHQPRGQIAADPHTALTMDDLIPARDRDVLRMISVDRIAVIQAEGAYTKIIISGAPTVMMLCAIGDWEARLPSPPFARLDRSRIVNLGKVTQAVAKNRNQTLLTLDGVEEQIELGRAASQRLRQLLG